MQANWWRVMAGLCLVAALAGPLLRSAEAADDLARLLSNLLERGEIVPRDGGVGDEPEDAIAKSPAPDALNLPSAADDLIGPSFLSHSSPASVAAAPHSVDGVLPLPTTARERLARLPILRF